MITGHSLRLGAITTSMALLVVLLTGGLFRVFSSKIVLALLAFTAWLCLCTPFSVWRGGSFSQVTSWLLSLISLILLAGCVEGLEHCRRAMYAMAVAVLAIEALSFVLGTSNSVRDDGRLSFVGGTFANANDLAALLLMGLPFCLLVVRTRKGMSLLKFGCIVGLLLIPITVVRTGSRGGLLALVIMFAIYFFSIPTLQKIPLAIGTLILAVAAMVFSSHDALERYKTIFRSSDETYYSSAAQESAALSTRARKELFMSSVRLTFHHPIVGVGPGMFQIADARNAEEEKHAAAWHQTHNTFTQISAEDGLPGLFLYMAALVLCFKSVRSSRQRALQHSELPALQHMAYCLRLSLLAFTITAVFASNAYYFYFPLVAGLCAALEQSAILAVQALPPREEGSKSPARTPRRPLVENAVPARFV